MTMKTIYELADQSNQVYYYNGREKEYLVPVEDRILIGLKSKKGKLDQTRLLNELDPQSNLFDIAKSYPDDVEMVPNRFIIAHLKGQWKSRESTDIDTLFEENSEIDCVSSLYRSNYPGAIVALTLDLLVKNREKDFP